MVHAEVQVTLSSGTAKLPKGFIVQVVEPELFNSSVLKLLEIAI